eukprot:gene18520-25024_t
MSLAGMFNTRNSFMLVIAVAFFFSQFLRSPPGIIVKQTVWNVTRPYMEMMGFEEKEPEIACGLLHWTEVTLISKRVVLPGGVQPAAVTMKFGNIASIVGVRYEDQVAFNNETGEKLDGDRVLNFQNAVISPGVIDVHAHLNEPGREEWEGVSTGTMAAVAGGITTVVDMPLNCDPTITTVTKLQNKAQSVQKKLNVDFGMWAGLVPSNAGNPSYLDALLYGGALGFKAFMCPSGINDFEHVEEKDLKIALPFLKKRGAPLYVHAEEVAPVMLDELDPTEYETYMKSRPPSFEQNAIKTLIRVLDEDETPISSPGFRVHIAHLADAGSLPLIQEAQQRGHPITVETCPHYLNFAAEDIAKGNTLMKCAPPIRGAANRDALRAAVASGAITIVGSDHSPAPAELKKVESGDFMSAWGGISGLQYLLPATWTALKDYGVDLLQLSQILSSEPAKLAGLGRVKGKIAVGYDADFVVWDPEQAANTTEAANQHKHKLSPYTDKDLKGKVLLTIVRGQFTKLFDAMGKFNCGMVVTRQKP